jgi:hypothetical protein
LTVQLTVSIEGYQSVSKTSAAVVVSQGVVTISNLAIEGTAEVGQTLHVNAFSYSPAGATLTFQWLRNGQPIPGATGQAYTVVEADVNQALSFLVTGTASGFETAQVESPFVMPGFDLAELLRPILLILQTWFADLLDLIDDWGKWL